MSAEVPKFKWTKNGEPATTDMLVEGLLRDIVQRKPSMGDVFGETLEPPQDNNDDDLDQYVGKLPKRKKK